MAISRDSSKATSKAITKNMTNLVFTLCACLSPEFPIRHSGEPWIGVQGRARESSQNDLDNGYCSSVAHAPGMVYLLPVRFTHSSRQDRRERQVLCSQTKNHNMIVENKKRGFPLGPPRPLRLSSILPQRACLREAKFLSLSLSHLNVTPDLDCSNHDAPADTHSARRRASFIGLCSFDPGSAKRPVINGFHSRSSI